MKKRYLLSFNVGAKGRRSIVPLLRDVGCLEGLCAPESILAGCFQYWFLEGDERLPELQRRLDRQGIRWSLRTEHDYSHDELLSAWRLRLMLRTAEKSICQPYKERFAGSDACSVCMTGSRSVRPLRVRSSGLPKRSQMWQTVAGEYLVAESVAERLRDSNLAGLELLQVESLTGIPLPWWEISTSSVLPRMARSTEGIVSGRPQEGCGVCKRDNYFEEPPTSVQYSKEDLSEFAIGDFARTWECFGISAFAINGYVARGLLIVSPRAYEVLALCKVRGLVFEPVLLVDAETISAASGRIRRPQDL